MRPRDYCRTLIHRLHQLLTFWFAHFTLRQSSSRSMAKFHVGLDIEFVLIGSPSNIFVLGFLTFCISFRRYTYCLITYRNIFILLITVRLYGSLPSQLHSVLWSVKKLSYIEYFKILSYIEYFKIFSQIECFKNSSCITYFLFPGRTICQMISLVDRWYFALHSISYSRWSFSFMNIIRWFIARSEWSKRIVRTLKRRFSDSVEQTNNDGSDERLYGTGHLMT